MPVSPRTSPNLAGSFANIQRGLGNIAELERTKPSVPGMVAEKIGNVFQTIMIQELKGQFDDRNKIKLTPEVVEDFENDLGQPLRPDVKASLKPFMGQMIDPSILQTAGKKAYEQSVQEGWLETVPEADRPLAAAASVEFQKGQVRERFPTATTKEDPIVKKQREWAKGVLDDAKTLLAKGKGIPDSLMPTLKKAGQVLGIDVLQEIEKGGLFSFDKTTTTIGPASDEEKASNYLINSGQRDTPANRRAVIKKGLVQ